MRSSFLFICVCCLRLRRRKHCRLHCFCHRRCIHHLRSNLRWNGHRRCRCCWSRCYGCLRKSYRSNAYCYRCKYSNRKFWSHSLISKDSRCASRLRYLQYLPCLPWSDLLRSSNEF